MDQIFHSQMSERADSRNMRLILMVITWQCMNGGKSVAANDRRSPASSEVFQIIFSFENCGELIS